MMAGNPNWWTMHPQPHHFIYGAASSSPSDQTPDFPVKSWSQLLLGGLGGGEEEEEDEERYGGGSGGVFQHLKKVESNWEEQQQVYPNFAKQELSHQSTQINYDDHEFQPWPRQHHAIPVSSPTSCVTTLSNSVLNFSGSKSAAAQRKNNNQDHSSECNSGGASKKARVQQSTAQPALKVRKEKLGDRITALHQLVSPFGKTDTASVLSEAIGYIRFLQGQIEALSSPYMRNGAGNTVHHQQHSVQERNCLFPEEPPQFLNDITMEGRGAPKQESQGRSGVGDLRSRGLCLVPISCTQHVGNDNGADYWAPAAFGGGF